MSEGASEAIYEWGAHMASAVSRAYNGGLGAEPPAGSRGSAPGQGVRGRSPPEAESFFAFGRAINAVKFDVLTVSVAHCIYT